MHRLGSYSEGGTYATEVMIFDIHVVPGCFQQNFCISLCTARTEVLYRVLRKCVSPWVRGVRGYVRTRYVALSND